MTVISGFLLLLIYVSILVPSIKSFWSQYSIRSVFRKQINLCFLSNYFYDMINTISAKEYQYESDSF